MNKKIYSLLVFLSLQNISCSSLELPEPLQITFSVITAFGAIGLTTAYWLKQKIKPVPLFIDIYNKKESPSDLDTILITMMTFGLFHIIESLMKDREESLLPVYNRN